MRRVAAGLMTLSVGACVMPMGMGMGGEGIGSNPEEARQMGLALQQSQADNAAQASRPGDASMDCAAIQAELMASMQDPKFKAAMASMGVRAGAEKAKIDAAVAGKAQTTAPGEAGAVAKGTGADIITMMPQIMRSQRLNELATAKKCAFLKPPG